MNKRFIIGLALQSAKKAKRYYFFFTVQPYYYKITRSQQLSHATHNCCGGCCARLGYLYNILYYIKNEPFFVKKLIQYIDIIHEDIKDRRHKLIRKQLKKKNNNNN